MPKYLKFVCMKFHIIQNEKGKPAELFIFISEWKMLKNQYKELEALLDEL